MSAPFDFLKLIGGAPFGLLNSIIGGVVVGVLLVVLLWAATRGRR